MIFLVKNLYLFYDSTLSKLIHSIKNLACIKIDVL